MVDVIKNVKQVVPRAKGSQSCGIVFLLLPTKRSNKHPAEMAQRNGIATSQATTHSETMGDTSGTLKARCKVSFKVRYFALCKGEFP